MKKKLIELDVDFIGGQGPLTKEEEKAISEYIRAYKARHAKKRPGKGILRTAGKRKNIPPPKRLNAVKRRRAL